MFRPLWQSLQVRLWIVFGCATLPLIFVVSWGYRLQYDEQVRVSEARVMQVLHESRRYEQVARDNMALLLGIMSRANDLAELDPASCTGLAQRLSLSHPHLANLGAVDANGEVFCSAQAVRGAVSVRDRAWFREAQALASATMTSGEFIVGRISGLSGIVFGYPLRGDDAVLRGALFASVHMDFFRPVVESMPHEPGWEIQVRTRDGRVVLSHPPAAADLLLAVRDQDAIEAALNALPATTDYIAEFADAAGNTRLFGLSPLGVADDQLVLVVASPLYLSIEKLRAEFIWKLAGALALLLLSVGIARWQVYGLIDGWAARAQGVLRQIGQGNLDAAITPRSSVRELSNVEEGLHALTLDLKHQREQNGRLLQAIEQSPVSVVITDTAGRIEYVNQKFVQISGYQKDEAIGQNPRILNRGLTPQSVYDGLWDTLTKGHVWSGEFINTRKDGSTYIELATISPVFDKQGRVSHYVGVKEDVTQLKASQDRLDRLSNYDLLTNLPNRRLLHDRIHRAALASGRAGHWSMLLLLDLDRFKILNETYGHEAGDRLLQTFAQRLCETVREIDTVARNGDNEFAVLIENLGEDEFRVGQRADQIAHKIHQHVAQPWVEPSTGADYRFSFTIGVTLFCKNSQGAEELLRQAAIAVNSGKEAGGNAIRFHDPSVQASLRQRAELEQAMRRAIEKKAFVVHLQPQVDSSGWVRGAEALVRWTREDGSVESPANFIPLAESTGLIVPIGQWVLGVGLKQLKHWAASPSTQHLDLSINISAAQFKHPDFVSDVLSGLQQEQVPAQRLILELTESVVLDDVDFVIERMEALRRIGVRFAIDDFGTGYSSLAYLRRLPLEQIKIDQGFIRDMLDHPSSQAIVKAVLAMSQAMNLDVVAEGVETPAQRAFLHQHGCTLLQGYLFGRPVPIEEFDRDCSLGPKSPQMPR
jgi:diguanylate cyclase (GGDEF)-like protein/PAS domain S-box-containing protein